MHASGKTEAEVVRCLTSELHEQVQQLRAEGLLAALPRQLREALQPLENDDRLSREEVRVILAAYSEVGAWSWSHRRPAFHVALIAFTKWMQLGGQAWWDECRATDAGTASAPLSLALEAR